VSTANKIQVVQCLLLTNWIGKHVSAAKQDSDSAGGTGGASNFGYAVLVDIRD
jgi:hypothetical protein